MSQIETGESRDIHSVYPSVAQFYKDNPSVEYFATSLDRTRFWFDAMAYGQDISKRVLGAYRIKTANKEMFYYSYVLVARDQTGNEIQWGDCKEGLEPVPIPHYSFNEASGQIEAEYIEEIREKYTLEFSKENINDMLEYCDDNTKFHIHDSGITYTTTRDLWCNESIEHAVEFNKTGRISKN